MTARPNSRIAVFLAGAAVSALALSGCASAFPGSAASVGENRIAEETIGDQLRSLNTTLGQPADTPSSIATIGLLTQGITGELINQVAADLGISVTQTQVDQAYALEVEQLGSQEALEQAAAQAFIPPEEINGFLVNRLAFSLVAQTLAPEAAPEQQQAVAVDAIVATGDELGVYVAPKYGEWSPAQLTIVPAADPLSKPAEQPQQAFDPLAPPQQ
jgi:hypothetical protein